MSTADAQAQPTAITEIIPADQRAANTAANLANSVTAIYGISGSGKSSLADTAAEYAWETFKKITLCYVADLGGFGNKRLSLIRAGIMRVWDPRNHADAFSTMELMSLGAFPIELVDPETGYAAPDVQLILPRRILYTMICPQGHDVKRSEDQRVFQASTINCPTCGVPTNLTNATRVDKQVVRHRLFRDVGFRIYDSFTALNAWGMDDLQRQSAKGLLPVSSQGGSALGGADALYSGSFKFSTGSKAQYGFLQNRTYGWLSNIKTIPDQVVPAIATFLVESTAGGDDTGGEPVYGLKIAGSAKTAEAASWVGNLLHATKEPNADGAMVHRLWLTNHIDPRDPRRVPYLAKHRGTPLGMPDFLEDAPGVEAWSKCSMKVFFTLLNEQLQKIESERAAKYGQTPGIWKGEGDGDVDDVVGVVGAGAGPANATAVAGDTAQVVRPTGRGLRRAGAVAPLVTAAVAAPVPAQQTVVTAQVGAATVPAASSSLAVAEAVPSGGAPNPATPTAVPSTSPVVDLMEALRTALPSPSPTPTSPPQPPVAPASPVAGPTSPSTSVAGARPLRRVARPPVG